jgi:site-specific DNA-methyltransferase (adenine-specific)
VGKAFDKVAGVERNIIGTRITNTRMQGGNYAGEKEDKKGGIVPVTGDPITDEAKQWNGWGTALKPAMEPICVARKPLIGTVCENVLKYGTGVINIDKCRVNVDPSIDDMLRNVERQPRLSATWKEGSGFKNENNSHTGVPSIGRWPAM